MKSIRIFAKRQVMRREKRERNLYWAIRIAETRKPIIGYGMLCQSKRNKKERFKFIYLGRWAARFAARRGH